MKKALLIFSILTISLKGIAQNAEALAINIKTQISNSGVTLLWNKKANVSNYNVLRKERAQKSFTPLAVNLGANDTTFTDNTVGNGMAYEYCVQSASDINVSGYVYAGIDLAPVHHAGSVMLIIDDTYQYAAATELEAYTDDLTKEGWKVITHYVSRSHNVAYIKQLIMSEYTANPNGFKGVVLLGHVAVPYSGKIAPDAHTDHVGAWPADVFYADVNTNWNDVVINTNTATDTRNHNLIGDGKYDISNKNTVANLKLFVGRVDVYNMSTINSDDVALFKQYLNKNHSYRAGLKKFKNQGLVQDNFGWMNGEAFAQNGWRNFASLVGGENVKAGNYMNDLKTDSYIWSYACAPGWNTGAQNLGTTASFSNNQMESVFTMLYGSYFGDWDQPNNFLRAPIASPSSTLVSMWGGRPNWYMHTMAMGEPIGYSYLNSVDNVTTYYPKGLYSGQIHQALIGDPTLKMYMIDAPDNLSANPFDNDTKVFLNWTPSSEQNVLGYYIYKANNKNDDFELITHNYVTDTYFMYELPQNESYNPQAIYMVKAVRLEQTNTGRFYNLSPGTMSSEFINTTLPVTITNFAGVANLNRTNTLNWEVENELNVSHYIVERSEKNLTFEEIALVEAKSSNNLKNTYTFNDENPHDESYYRIKAIDADGKEVLTQVVQLSHQRVQIEEVVVYPSPFHSQLSVNVECGEEGTLSISLLDIYGKNIQTTHQNAQAGLNKFSLLGVENLPIGTYFVKINTPENETKVVKVLKH